MAQNKISESALPSENFKLPPQLQTSVDNIVKREGYITHKVVSRPITTGGGNYMAELFAVEIKGQTVYGEKETNMFIKNKVEGALSIMDANAAYNSETFFYSELTKLYNDLQNKANIPLEERYNMVKVYDAANSDAIILENLDKQGFTTHKRKEVASLKFVKLSVQQLARFHGLSCVFEKRFPEYFATKIKIMQIPLQFNDDYQGFMNNMTELIKKHLDEDSQIKLTKFNTNAAKKLDSYFRETAGVTCTLCHGDYKPSNILMKKQGEEVSKVIPVDYQTLHYGSPVMDLICLIFTATDAEFRRHHLDGLKNLYHVSLAKFLAYFDMDVEAVYPRKKYEFEFKNRLAYGLYLGIILLPLFFADDNDVPDFTNEKVSEVAVTTDPKMGKRAIGLVDEFRKWGIL